MARGIKSADIDHPLFHDYRGAFFSYNMGCVGVFVAQYFMGFSPGTWQFWAVMGYGLACFMAGKVEA